MLEIVRERDQARGEGSTELLLITGGEDIVAANRAEELGAHFLHKPFASAAILRFLDRVRSTGAFAERAAAEATRLADRANLPERVRQLFLLVVARTGSREICAIMGISEDTQKTYLKVLIRELRRVGIDAKDRKDVVLAVWATAGRVLTSSKTRSWALHDD